MEDALQQQLQALFQQVQALAQSNQQLEQQMHDQDMQIAQQEAAKKAATEPPKKRRGRPPKKKPKIEEPPKKPAKKPQKKKGNAGNKGSGTKSTRNPSQDKMPESDEDSINRGSDDEDKLRDMPEDELEDKDDDDDKEDDKDDSSEWETESSSDDEIPNDGVDRSLAGCPPEVLAFIEEEKAKLGPRWTDPKKERKKRRRKKKKNPKIIRTRYSNKEKYTIVKLLEEGYSKKQLMKEFNLPKNTLNDWLSKRKNNIIAAVEDKMEINRKCYHDSPLFRLMEKPLIEYVERNAELPEDQRVNITNVLLSKQAKNVRDELIKKDDKESFLTPKERKALEGFGASTSWSSIFARKNAWKCPALRTRKKSRNEPDSDIDDSDLDERHSDEETDDEDKLPDDKLLTWMESSQEMARLMKKDPRFQQQAEALSSVLFQIELTWKREKIWAKVEKKKKFMESGGKLGDLSDIEDF